MKTLGYKAQSISNGTGLMMELQETSVTNIDLRWGHYVNPMEQTITMHPEKSSIVSHFQLSRRTRQENCFVVCRESSQPHDINVSVTEKSSNHQFFELIMAEGLINRMITDESPFLTAFGNYDRLGTLSFTGGISAHMYQIISDMKETQFRGNLKQLYLETKAIELFLAEVRQFDTNNSLTTKLKPKDIDCLNDLKRYIDCNFLSSLSIIDLSKRIGINQTKLKSGFKLLFNTSAFAYITSKRLEEARRLLLEEKMTVNEVSERIGYKHAHHFTVAFKRKFHYLPSQIKC